MAILDMQNMLSYKQAITVTAASTNVIDLGPNMWNKASGNDKSIPLDLFIDEAFTAADAATLDVAIQSSNDSAFDSGNVTHQTVSFALAGLALAKKTPKGLAIPPDVKRYVRAYYTVGTGPMTAGKLTLAVPASQMTNIAG